MNAVATCPLCGGNLSPADAGTRSQCDNCGAKVNVVTGAFGSGDRSAESAIRSALDALEHMPSVGTIRTVCANLRQWLEDQRDSETEVRFDDFVRTVRRRAGFGRAWTGSNLRPLFDAGCTVDEVLALKPEGR